MTATTTTTVMYAVGGDVNNLVKRITTAFPSGLLDTSTTWSLSNTLYRSIPVPSATQSSTSKHIHILQLSSQPGRTLICIGGDTGASEAISIDSGSATSDFSRLLREKFGPLWQPLRNGDLRISNGICWEVGLFRVQIGELMRDRGATGGGLENRGTVIAVSVLAEALTTNQEFEDEKEMLREFCQVLELDSPQRNSTMLAESWGSFASWNTEATLWCDILRKVISIGSSGRAKPVEQ